MYLSTKNTILKAYDGQFKDIFAEVYETSSPVSLGCRHHVRAPAHRRHGRGCHEVGGGYVWACKNRR